jgi:hypothetical protein
MDAQRIFRYNLFFPVDGQTEWVRSPFNNKDVCFRKAHLSDPKASDEEMRRARAAMADSED